MVRITYYVAASLDGFIADAARGVDWLPQGNSDDYGYAGFYAGVETLVMGRRTYDQALTFGDWPYPGKTAYVFTRTPPSDGPPEVRFVQANPPDFVRDIEERHSGAVWLVGGADLADQFRQAGLIDEYRVFVVPVILGQGVPLFGGPGAPTVLQLESADTHVDGLVELRYRASETV
ncbi:Uncharacterized protein YwjB [Geodia barretti]|uniref:Uncharacterized protein YwjB n=1 Tax=Geodia barretti TaxID=519541 RepID=A0AA35R0A9_GEOBA|nr:Uncharacterized protein YwjB [Geodia barretti]